MFYHRTWQLLASQARPFLSSADRFQYPPCDDRVDKIRVDSTWQHVHMQTCCMWIRALRLIYSFTLNLVKAVHAIELPSLASHTLSVPQHQSLSHNSILGQTHTAALHSRFTNCTPNTRVDQSRLMDRNIIQAFFSAAGGCSEMSVCFPLATKLPEMHPFSDIQY